MFPYPIAKPQNCDIQTFYGNKTVLQSFTWNKPIAASHVYMLLIGGGGAGDETLGGGSGAVTVWYGAAQNVPNSLVITPASSNNGNHTIIYYRGRSLISLLVAQTANGFSAGAPTTSSPFAASGFYKSIEGQQGAGGDLSASSNTFLNAGTPSTGINTANYGYIKSGNQKGYFQMQPIIVGIGGGGTGNGDIGGGGGISGVGGSGMVLIASW